MDNIVNWNLPLESYNPFSWNSRIVILDIIGKIELGYYKVFPLEFHSKNTLDWRTEDWEVYCNCIDNFVELGKKWDMYKGSLGTDGNPIISWKIQTHDGKWFFVIGKYNHVTLTEDITVFYNDSPIFEVVKCRLVASGSVDDEPFYSFWKICRKYMPDQPSET